MNKERGMWKSIKNYNSCWYCLYLCMSQINLLLLDNHKYLEQISVICSRCIVASLRAVAQGQEESRGTRWLDGKTLAPEEGFLVGLAAQEVLQQISSIQGATYTNIYCDIMLRFQWQYTTAKPGFNIRFL